MASLDLEQLRSVLQSNEYEAIREATIIGRQSAAESTDIVVSVYDKFWSKIGEVNDYIELAVSKPRNQVAVLTFTLKGSDPLIPILRNCRKEVVGLTVQIGALRWAYTVEETSYKLTDGLKTLSVKALSLYHYLNHVMCWPSPFLPLATQVPSRAVFVGPIVTCINTMIAENAFRLQSGLWELVNNPLSLNLDWRTWFGTFLQSRGDLLEMLKTPLYVCHVNPLLDSSPFVSITSRMEPVAGIAVNIQDVSALVQAVRETVQFVGWIGRVGTREHDEVHLPAPVAVAPQDIANVPDGNDQRIDAVRLGNAQRFENLLRRVVAAHQLRHVPQVPGMGVGGHDVAAEGEGVGTDARRSIGPSVAEVDDLPASIPTCSAGPARAGDEPCGARGGT